MATARRKPKSERKEEVLRIRVSKEQKDALADAAKKDGLDVSTWLRSLALKAISFTGESLDGTAARKRRGGANG
jgi:hypothetical protein